MKFTRKLISILVTLTMLAGSISFTAFAAEEADAPTPAADTNLLTEPFDVANEDAVDAGVYPYDHKTVLVKLPQKAATLEAEGIADIEYLFGAKDGYWYSANLTDGTTPKEAITLLRSMSGILIAEYNFIYQADGAAIVDGEGISADVSGNGKTKDQWHLDSCGFQKAWKKLKNDKYNPGGDSGIVVAVIDTGVDYDHEDLKNNIWTNSGEVPGDGKDNDGNGYIDDYYGVDIVAGRGNGDDDHGHGTHVAGIIAAANNNVGVVGLAYNTTVMPVKAGQASGYFLQKDVCKAIEYARENGADVINMSFGGIASTIAVQDALEAAYTHSVLVAAAGNDGMHNEGHKSKPCYPAAYSFVLGVMAVDDHGVETGFTNYDILPCTSVEYEVYAPGNAITSTIPNDRYATWNGTSMAAPIVSAMAAVLKSVYSDPDMYPTKFIYGQIVSTSERGAECIDPQVHGAHNLPQIANLYDALTKMPKPQVGAGEYKTFDSSDISKNNNGDGTIDAGEIISLGFELRNRWGMSKDTVVTVDALSPADIPNPYVSFSSDGKDFGDSASVNYGSVGTYSSQDCGKVMDGELWTGWENPFYLKVSKDAPNETILAINVTISAKNALDAKDEFCYSSINSINLIVKNGVVLPQVIKEDMTLTKDNYYIIQNSTIIEEGATVTVTEGTNIQFWTNDSTDPYTENYMAGLLVKGKLDCIGTEEEPIKIFPSDLMGNYRVDIYEYENGEINYKHTNITNLNTGESHIYYRSGFTLAENCEFTQNYKSKLYYKELSGSDVVDKVCYTNYINGDVARNCAFYKLGSDHYNYPVNLSVDCYGCIFADSFINFAGATSDGRMHIYENCVFYGNNNFWDSTSVGGVSTFEIANGMASADCTVDKIVRDRSTGTSYIQIKYNGNERFLDRFLTFLGADYAYIETQEEQDFISASGLDGYIKGSSVEKAKKTDSFILEIAGDVFVEDITFERDKMITDTQSVIQLHPIVYPYLAKDFKVAYFSGNEAVVTVDENGVVTPIAQGLARVYVFSEDMQVSAYVDIEVKGEVKATEIDVPEKLQIDIGETLPLNAKIHPANTTKNTIYQSSDETIATVDAQGNVTALAEGEVVITTSVINGDETLSAHTHVMSVIPVESMLFNQKIIYCGVDESKAVKPTIYPADATNQNLIWDSSNEDICYVDADGNLVGVSEGLATLKVVAENTDISAYVDVCVSSDIKGVPEIVDIVRESRTSGNDMYCIVTADHQLLMWGICDDLVYNTPAKLDMYYEDEKLEIADIAFYKEKSYSTITNFAVILDTDGNLYHTYYFDSIYEHHFGLTKIAENVVKLLDDISDPGQDNMVAVTADGSVIVMGRNLSSKLGVGGTDQYLNSPVYVTLDSGEKVVDGLNSGEAVFLLTENGNLYVSGYYDRVTNEYFTKVYEGITEIDDYMAYTDTQYINLRMRTGTEPVLSQHRHMVDILNYDEIYLEDGKLYRDVYDHNMVLQSTEVLPLDGIKDVINRKMVNESAGYFGYGGYFCITENDDLYYFSEPRFNSTTPVQYIPMVSFVLADSPALRKNDNNLQNVTYDENGNITYAELTEDELVIGFDSRLNNGAEYDNIVLTADGNIVATKKYTDLNCLSINVGGGFKEETTYVLTIPAGAYMNDSSVSNEEITIVFYRIGRTEEDAEIGGDTGDVPEDGTQIPDADGVHVHSFVTDTLWPTADTDGKITNICQCGVTSETILPRLVHRDLFDTLDFDKIYTEYTDNGFDTDFRGNAIINRLIDADVSKWLRITAGSSGDRYSFGGNWWGTTNTQLINHQIVDHNDFATLGDINEGAFLTEAPENTFPFVTEAYLLDETGEAQTVVSGGNVQFVVKFNRDMDTEYGAKVFFGSAYPYADYEIYGSFADARTWIGETTLKTVIENGYQYIRVTEGRTAPDENGEHLKLYTDWARFGFEIDTTTAMAMMMQGYADDDGIHLEWMQDDYDTLAGYNVYRADSEDGDYVRLNKTIIPSEENTYVDTDVEPGKKYYYTFRVVLTDITAESNPAGKISIAAKDTMAPSVYHSPVYTATTGNKIIVSATISDNIGVQSVALFFRTKGTEEWKCADMSGSNNKYTASIPAAFASLEGVEYYIVAYDGVNYTYAGSRTEADPYEIAIYQAVENNSKGDVDGNGTIDVLDALMLLRAIYDETLLTQEEFLRGDINGDGTLSAVEALRILQYANKTISSVLW